MTFQRNDWVGDYRLVAPLGAGGFGDVWRATDRMERVVAIKLLHATLDETSKRRFVNEARIIARLSHPHCVASLGFGELPSGQMFLVTELLDGATLDRWALQSPPPTAVRVVAIQVAGGLAAAHALGVIHRDLKPANIFVRDSAHGPHATVLDFGIAKLTGEFGGDVTATGEVFGTPQYMSPEQFRDAKRVTVASDVYSLGVVLYELFEQRPLFRGTLIEIAMQHMTQAPPAMERVGADVERLIHAMLAKDPAARPRSMSDVIQQLTALDLTFTEHDATRRAERPVRPIVTPASTEPAARATRIRLVVAVGALLAVGIAFAALWQPASTTAPVAKTRMNPLRLASPESEPAPLPDSVTVLADEDTGGVAEEDATAPAVARPDAMPIGKGCARRLPIDKVSDTLPFIVPSSYTPGVPTPVVIVLHDTGQQPDHWLSYERFQQLAERDGVILLVPQSPAHKAWSDRNDRLEVAHQVDRISDELCLDGSRIGMIGFGKGGEMVHRLNCHLSPLHPTRAVAVNHQHKDERYDHCEVGEGDGDPVAPLLAIHALGDTVVDGRCDLGQGAYVPVETATKRLQEFYRCSDRTTRIAESPDGWHCVASDACMLPLTVCEQPEGRYWPEVTPRGTFAALFFAMKSECVTTGRAEPDFVWQFLTDWD